MMTEQEATAKWCPFARVARIGSCRCIASACMAWRWHHNVEEKLDTKGRRTGRQLASITDRGFCGLAGRPGP